MSSLAYLTEDVYPRHPYSPFYFYRKTTMLASGCAAAVSLRPGCTRTSKKHNNLQNICREFNPSSLSCARTPSPPPVAFGPPAPSRSLPPPLPRPQSACRPAGPPPAPWPKGEDQLEVPACAHHHSPAPSPAPPSPRIFKPASHVYITWLALSSSAWINGSTALVSLSLPRASAALVRTCIESSSLSTWISGSAAMLSPR